MVKEKMKNDLIHLTLFWVELQIKTRGKYHLPFLPASQPSVWYSKIILIEGLSKFMSFLQKNRTIDWKVVTTRWCKTLQQGFIWLFICSSFHSLSFQWWILKSFKNFFLQVARVLAGILNWFAASLLGLPFSSSFNASYFTFKVTSWCFLFLAIFIASASSNRIQTNLKISKHSNIMELELKHSNLLQ